MESMFEDDISILTQEALGPSEVWLDGPGDPSLGGDMCSASHFALITAYGDIKERLGGLERENATLRRRLKVYEIKDGSLLEVEKVSLQQRLNQFQHELQKSKEQEEQLGEMIQAYEKLCVEKSDLETELGEMRALVETHLRQICGLEKQLQQQQGLRDAAFSSLSPPAVPASACPDLDLHYLALRGGPALGHAGWPGPTSVSVSELERRRLEEALEAAQGEARGAQLREEQLQAECERLQGELKQLQETRAQDLASNQSECDTAAHLHSFTDTHSPPHGSHSHTFINKGPEMYTRTPSLPTRFGSPESFLPPPRAPHFPECRHNRTSWSLP